MSAQLTRRVRLAVIGVAIATLAGALALSIDAPFVLERATGWWALGLLGATLAITPLRLAVRRRADLAVVLHRMRRLLGLSAAAIAALHATLSLSTYFGARAAIEPTLTALTTLPWLRNATLALALLVALALGSLRPIVRRLRAWSALHRLVYPAAVLSALHALLGPRADSASLVALVAIAVALVVRPLAAVLERARTPRGET